MPKTLTHAEIDQMALDMMHGIQDAEPDPVNQAFAIGNVVATLELSVTDFAVPEGILYSLCHMVIRAAGDRGINKDVIEVSYKVEP